MFHKLILHCYSPQMNELANKKENLYKVIKLWVIIIIGYQKQNSVLFFI